MANKTVSKEWHTWTISREMWGVIRPWVKVLQNHCERNGLEYFYNISECYDNLAFSLYSTMQEYIDMDIALRTIGDYMDNVSPILLKQE